MMSSLSKTQKAQEYCITDNYPPTRETSNGFFEIGPARRTATLVDRVEPLLFRDERASSPDPCRSQKIQYG